MHVKYQFSIIEIVFVNSLVHVYRLWHTNRVDRKTVAWEHDITMKSLLSLRYHVPADEVKSNLLPSSTISSYNYRYTETAIRPNKSTARSRITSKSIIPQNGQRVFVKYGVLAHFLNTFIRFGIELALIIDDQPCSAFTVMHNYIIIRARDYNHSLKLRSP